MVILAQSTSPVYPPTESFATEEEVFAAWFGDTACSGHDCPGCPECDPAGDGDDFGPADSWPDWTDQVSPRLREGGDQ